ncbi:MAG: hypothetical protein HYV16_06100 [Gammaproteobacteria bacterium]|nr:hypothetical protein [Gammaproteobacteria bacterium]
MMVLFLLVVVSILVAALTRLNAGGQAAMAQEILSVRALFAAETGAQAMAMSVFPLNGAAACPATQSRAYAQPGLAGCRSETSCASATAGGQTVFSLTSTGECSSGGCGAASCTAGAEQSRRRLRVQLRAPGS